MQPVFLAFQFDNLIKFAKDWNLKLTLVLPIFSEKDLKLAKKKIIKILQNSKSVIDEVTVNDFGMLTYIQSKFDKKVNLGRLFFKDPRDVRVNEYYSQKGNVNILSALEEVIDEMVATLKDRHIARLKNGSCTIGAGLVFIEVLTHMGRAADQCSSIAVFLLGRHNEEILSNHHAYLHELHKGNDAYYASEFEARRREFLDPIETL